MTTKIEDRLKQIGLLAASKRITDLKELKRKMAIAYEHFRYVRPEKIEKFNQKLREETMIERGDTYQYKQLVFIELGQYTEVPPLNVLDDIEKAQNLNCFDSFEVAKIQDVVEVKDPIVFGRIKDCPDRFFVSQWDDDVKIEQILNENEG